MTSIDIHGDARFYATAERFYIVPEGNSEVLIIDRTSQQVSVEPNANLDHLQGVAFRRIYGIVGTIKLIQGDYLILVTGRAPVGTVKSHTLWRMEAFDVVPLAPVAVQLSDSQRRHNEMYLAMLTQMLNTPSFYFSYTFDITHTLQRQHAIAMEKQTSGLYERADARFVWNGFLLKNFQQNKSTDDLRRYCLPLILGYVSVCNVQLNGHDVEWTLLSRRSVFRAGTKLFRRGIDTAGNVANYVETEQIIDVNGETVSFVQTRGSIPLYWHQQTNMRLLPPIRLLPDHDHASSCSKHLDSQQRIYGRQVLINLINHQGKEGALEQAFAETVANLGNAKVRYESYDFHTECRKMRYDRLNNLIARVAHEQDEFGVFHQRGTAKAVSSQSGVFRTNCMDCLDRTNVVQSMLAKRSMEQSFIKFGILTGEQQIDSDPNFHRLFRDAWANHADAISLQYSGTGAMKTDYTRTGKRSAVGVMRDMRNGLVRFYKNNFTDGFRQDAFDLFLGNYIVQDGEGGNQPCPLEAPKNWRYGTFLTMLVFTMTMFWTTLVLPSQHMLKNASSIAIWGSLVGVSGSLIFRHNEEFIDWPKLIPYKRSST